LFKKKGILKKNNNIRKNSMYRLFIYYLAKVFAEIPSNLLGPLILGAVVYFLTPLQKDFLKFVNFQGTFYNKAFNIMTAFASIYLGCCIGAVSKDVEVGSAIAPLFAIIFFLVAG
jgi:hypothetical protein